MKSSLAVLACLASLAVASSVSAQLVHLTATGTVLDTFGGAAGWSGGAAGETTTATFDLYYDARLQPMLEEGVPYGTFTPGDATTHRWRLRFGELDISAPWQRLAVSDTDLRLEYFDEASYTTLDLTLAFASDPSEGFALPVPPLAALAPAGDPTGGGGAYPSQFGFDTFTGFGLEAGTLFVGIEQLSAEVVPSGGGMNAVPEPSTYAWGAVVVCVLATVTARRRRAALHAVHAD